MPTRDTQLQRLKEEEFDLIVIGGGIFGALAYWLADKRGLKVALVEKFDYCSGVSANSYKIIHGGIRYLQHLDIPRILSSCRERSFFLESAPHLCTPLPIIIPTYGYGKLGKFFLGAGCLVYDLITFSRNRPIRDRSRHIPYTRFLSRKAVLAEYPELRQDGLTGAVLIHDGRFYNPTRLVWAYIESTSDRSVALNYLEAEGLRHDEHGELESLAVHDHRSGERFSIRCKGILNASGPWAERWLNRVSEGEFSPGLRYSRDFCFVIDNPTGSTRTLAVQGEQADKDAVLAREKRHLFISPWRNYWLIGVWHRVVEFHPERIEVAASELQTCVDEINRAYPGLSLTLDDVHHYNTGLVPFGEDNGEVEDLSFGKRTNILDYPEGHPLHKVITVIGLRYTMARAEAHKALEKLLQRLMPNAPSVEPSHDRVESAQFARFDQLLAELSQQCKASLSAEVIEALAHNHGARALRIVESINHDLAGAELIPGTRVTVAEVNHVCDNEQVETLADVALRRTDIATAGHPGKEAIDTLAFAVGKQLGWDGARISAEVRELDSLFRPLTLR